MFYLMTHSTHFIYGYMVTYIWQRDHSDSKRGNPPIGYSFRLVQGYLYMHHPTDRIPHTTVVTPVDTVGQHGEMYSGSSLLMPMVVNRSMLRVHSL